MTKPINSMDVEDAFRRVHGVLVLASAAVSSDTVDRDGVKEAIAAIDYDDPAIMEPGQGVDWHGDDSDRLSSLHNALRVCRLLAVREMTLRELAAELGMGARTVRRYIYALQLAGLDVLVYRGQRGHGSCRYRLDARSWHGFLSLPLD